MDPAAYVERLQGAQGRGWKRWVPNPYRWRLRRVCPAPVLEVGCGIGRLLGYLDGAGVGIDTNAHAVAACRAAGFEAYTPAEFAASPAAATERYGSLLLAHVLEHVDEASAERLIADHLPYVRSGGRVVLVTPQERGYRSDPTHVRFVDAAALAERCRLLGLRVLRADSFPLPRAAGRWFVWNEFWVVADKT